jgi:hypothetical protein
MEHKRGNEAYMLSCTGVLVVGVTSVARERGRERERERERERVPACVRLCLSRLPRPSRLNVPLCEHDLCVNVTSPP